MSIKLHELIAEELKHGNTQVALKRCIDYALNTSYQSNLAPVVRQMAAVLNEPEGPDNHSEMFSEFLKLCEKNKLNTLEQTNKCVLKVENISKQYRVGAFQFKPTSFDLNTGSLVGIVGQNGNGKTTLLRMLCGDLLPSTGEIHYPLLPQNNNDPYAIKQHIGFIPQRIPKWYGLLEDNLKFALSTREVKEEEILFRVEIMLKRLGLYEFRHHAWSEISSGYRTRFELARVLLTRPKILVLDEPLANLDVKAQQTFLQDLKYMAKTDINPIAVILSSQLLHEVEQVSDELIFIKDGTCLFQSGEENNNTETIIIEFISETPFDKINTVVKRIGAELKAENNFYTITASKDYEAKALLKLMMTEDIDVQYFRDITNSTKRLF